MTIDGKRGNAFGSHKYAGKSTLRYELGIDILKGNLVWVEGLYLARALAGHKDLLEHPCRPPPAG